MSKKIYCGVEKINAKKQRLGTMKECAENKQIRLYGLKKVDPRLIEGAKNKSKKKESRGKIVMEKVRLSARKNALTKKLAAEKDVIAKHKLREELKKTEKEYEVILAKFRAVNKKSGTPRKGSIRKGSLSRAHSRIRSRKGSRRGSRKGLRRGSRKGSRLSRRNSRRWSN